MGISEPRMKKKIFLSSTVYDLIDIRAEISESLRKIGFDVITSDEPTSGFVVATDANSIESCLRNLEQSDEVILILSQRYGPSLKNAGYDHISATHLEYRHAVKHKKLIHLNDDFIKL